VVTTDLFVWGYFMNCKKIYLGQKIESKDWNYGLGSVYLAGPRNLSAKSWRLDLISKIEKSGSPVSIFIPETQKQLSDGICDIPQNEMYEWQNFAISAASAIIFWYPKGAFSVQSFVEFGIWHKAERIFLGREDQSQIEYLEWLLYKEQLLYPAENLDQITEMFLHWIKE